MCLYPRLIRNKKFVSNKKNKGMIPIASDERALLVPVGCGKCIECRKKKSRDWQVRLFEELKLSKNGKFVTLTFNEDSLKALRKDASQDVKNWNKELDNKVCILAVKRFLERHRKRFKVSIRHWLVSERGHTNTKRIHLHGILFTDLDNDEIEKFWKYGYVYTGDYVNEATVNYVVKYVTKLDLENKGFEPVVLCSPGIGRNFLSDNKLIYNGFRGRKTRDFYLNRNGSKIALPIYYRNMLYSDEEREQLWMSMLDKNQRFVLGEMVDVSINNEDYFKLLEFARIKNKKLGYGDDNVNFSEDEYLNKLKYINSQYKKYLNKY